MDTVSLKINGENVVVSESTAKIYKHFQKKIETLFVPEYFGDLFVESLPAYLFEGYWRLLLQRKYHKV